MTVATVDILWTGTMCANNGRPFGVEVIWEDGDRLIVLVDDGQVWQVNRRVVKRDNEMIKSKSIERPVDRVAKAVKLCQPSKAQTLVETALDRLLAQAHKVLDMRYLTGNLPNDSNVSSQLEVLSVLLQHFETDRLAWAESVLAIHGKG